MPPSVSWALTLYETNSVNRSRTQARLVTVVWKRFKMHCQNFVKERRLQLGPDKPGEFREGVPSQDEEGGREECACVLRHSEKPGPSVVEGVCPQMGRNQKEGIFKSSGELGPKCPVGRGAPAVLRFQPLSLFRELAQDWVGQSWAGVAPLSCKLHPSLHSRKGVALWSALSHPSLVLAEQE